MCKNKNNISAVERLRNNAVFQLSLSSKELFHSNFLYWMATDTELPSNFFPTLMKEAFGFGMLENDPQWRDKYEVLREYKNFDFCICRKLDYLDNYNDDPIDSHGQVVFLLENKFKSLPYEEQLREYSGKVMDLNIEAANKQKELNLTYALKDIEEYADRCTKALNDFKKKWKKENNKKQCGLKNLKRQEDICKFNELTARLKEAEGKRKLIKDEVMPAAETPITPYFVLLTLAKPSFKHDQCWEEKVKGQTYTWNIVRYSDYARKLKESVKCIRLHRGHFRKSLLKQYVDFLETFAGPMDDAISKITGTNNFLEAFEKKPFSDLRVDDIWKKMVADRICRIFADQYGSKYSICTDGDYKKFAEKKQHQILCASSFTRSTGIVNFLVPLDSDRKYAFTIQIQGKQYRYCLEWKGGSRSSEHLENVMLNGRFKNIEQYFRFNNNNPKPISEVTIDDTVSPKLSKDADGSKDKPSSRGFCKFGKDFIYQYWTIGDSVKIGTLVGQVYKDIKSVLDSLQS